MCYKTNVLVQSGYFNRGINVIVRAVTREKSTPTEATLSNQRAVSPASWIAESGILSCSHISVKMRAQKFVISLWEVRSSLG